MKSLIRKSCLDSFFFSLRWWTGGIVSRPPLEKTKYCVEIHAVNVFPRNSIGNSSKNWKKPQTHFKEVVSRGLHREPHKNLCVSGAWEGETASMTPTLTEEPGNPGHAGRPSPYPALELTYWVMGSIWAMASRPASSALPESSGDGRKSCLILPQGGPCRSLPANWINGHGMREAPNRCVVYFWVGMNPVGQNWESSGKCATATGTEAGCPRFAGGPEEVWPERQSACLSLECFWPGAVWNSEYRLSGIQLAAASRTLWMHRAALPSVWGLSGAYCCLLPPTPHVNSFVQQRKLHSSL